MQTETKKTLKNMLGESVTLEIRQTGPAYWRLFSNGRAANYTGYASKCAAVAALEHAARIGI